MKFDHTQPTLARCLGVSDERFDELFESAWNDCLEHLRPSELIDMAMNSPKLTTDTERFLWLFLTSRRV